MKLTRENIRSNEEIKGLYCDTLNYEIDLDTLLDDINEEFTLFEETEKDFDVYDFTRYFVDIYSEYLELTDDTVFELSMFLLINYETLTR